MQTVRGSNDLDRAARVFAHGRLLARFHCEEVIVRRYEYRHLNVDINELTAPAFDDKLATFGRDGWELVTTIPHEKHGYSHAVHMIFIRPLEERA